MPTATLAAAPTATAAGMAMLLCVVLSQRRAGRRRGKEGPEKGIQGGGEEERRREAEMERRFSKRQAEPPATWQEAVATVAETIRFTYSETLGRWSIGDLAFGIKHHMRRQVGELDLMD
ncbi:hypothetical protein AXF42_Ash013903 [Apostasia shenzhenica]|uniref:Mono-/di-acylglycerol lipase N-terminal domain-containing protein n=1 Tax=Apostasia shenzhenica TaxID=1088818 RepID=A0A2I0AS74_9ASPA|nr:hypothetical protein AXF42_Ash013903 [Apostasia shenzhenica]